jgi:hypothetical protein
MKICFTSAVQFTAEIECVEGAPLSIKIGLAVKVALKADVNLSGADLSGAYLPCWANLSGAYLTWVSLSNAVLDSTDNLGFLYWHAFIYATNLGELHICVGCRNKTIAEARDHWADPRVIVVRSWQLLIMQKRWRHYVGGLAKQ